MLTPRILEECRYNRFEWNNGTIIEYWKPLAANDDFDHKVCVRFGEWKDEPFSVYIVALHSMYNCKHIKTISDLEKLYTLLSGRTPNKSINPTS